jgi:hypothetical protein
MSEGRCGADISQVREAYPTSDLGWLDKFESTCCEPAGHEGKHVFGSLDTEDDQQLHWDSGAKHFSSYQSAPPAQDTVITF